MTPADQSARTRALAALAPVIPVIVIRDAAHAPRLAEALVAGGLPALEVTLRTEGALAAIRAMADVPGGEVGAGTVLTRDDAMRARDAGARFAVAPGLTERLAAACEEIGLPLLPGVNSPSEAMRAAEMGYDMLKFFPAEPAGGVPMLRAMHGPLPRLSFCPTGGITAANANAYLSLPNVPCVGGSWVVPDAAVTAGDWAGIERLAREARALRA